MKIRLEKSKVNRLFVLIGYILTFYSSACLWNENNLRNYILCSVVVVFLSIIIFLTQPISISKIINNRYVIWVIITYTIFETYGFFRLKAGQFNWDFILVSGVLQISLTIMLMTLKDNNEVISTYCIASLISIVIVCINMVLKGSIRLSNIRLGSSFGLELSGNRNTVATTIGILLIPVTYMTLKYKKYRTVLFAISVFAAGCMLLTGSKKGIVVLVVIMLMVFISDKGSVKYLIFPFVAILGVYAVFNVPVLYKVIGFRLKDMFATLGIGTAVTSAQSTYIRNSYIIMGLKSMWNHPLFGGGMNYFQFINSARYYSHNNYIELLNNFGIVGTLIYYLPALKKFPLLNNKIREKKHTDEYATMVFLLFFFISKFALDYAMVSYSTMCVFNIQFLLIFEVLRRERISNAR